MVAQDDVTALYRASASGSTNLRQARCATCRRQDGRVYPGKSHPKPRRRCAPVAGSPRVAGATLVHQPSHVDVRRSGTVSIVSRRRRASRSRLPRSAAAPERGAGVCVLYGVVRRLFRALVSGRTRVTEVACEASAHHNARSRSPFRIRTVTQPQRIIVLARASRSRGGAPLPRIASRRAAPSP